MTWKIANVINFFRGCEPRNEDDSFLITTAQNELALCREFGFRSTVLLQFDALEMPDYRELCRQHADEIEVGLWLEIVEPLCQRAGLPWRGRYPWDWKIDCNITVAYTQEERRKLADEAFEGFRDYFGYYPKVAGCWIIDAFTLDYINKKYGLDAFCICRDQYGTDGMTLWGGVYNGGYYPSKTNLIMPAVHKENQIDLPVFRMLGPDPIYQYDEGLGSPEERQGVVTLEPVYPFGGGSENWVDNYFNENYGREPLSHAYAQFGQENSFGWDSIGQPLKMQLKKLRAKVDAGEIEALTLGETGRRFSQRYAETPPNSILTLNDGREEENKSLWYWSKRYRINILKNGQDEVWVRDLQLYDDGFCQEYLNSVCRADRCSAFALPMVDGFRFSKDNVRAGLYPTVNGERIKASRFTCEKIGESALRLDCGSIIFTLREDRLEITLPAGGVLDFVFADVPRLPYREHGEKEMNMAFADFTGEEYRYAVRLDRGCFAGEDRPAVKEEKGKVIFDFRS